MRTVTGPTDRVVVVGAGLGGLACALHLAGGRPPGHRASSAKPVPGGRAGRLSVRRVRVRHRPDRADHARPDRRGRSAAVGEELDDWLELTPLDPAYRAYYPDGSTLDVHHRHRPDGRRDLPGLRRPGGRRLPAVRRLRPRAVAAGARPTSSTATWTAPSTCSPATCCSCSAAAAFRRLQPKINQFFRDPRTQRIFSFQAMYAGLAPHDALAHLRGDRVPGLGGRRLLPARRHPRGPPGAGRRRREARRAVPVRHRRSTRVETADGRATGVHHRRRRADPGRRGGAQPGPAGRLPGPAARAAPAAPAALLAVLRGAARRLDAGVLRRSPITTSTSDGPGRAPSTR